MSNHLMPCPFCGNDKPSHSAIRDGREIVCQCGASMHAFQPNALKKAIDRWNTRAPIQSSPTP